MNDFKGIGTYAKSMRSGLRNNPIKKALSV